MQNFFQSKHLVVFLFVYLAIIIGSVTYFQTALTDIKQHFRNTQYQFAMKNTKQDKLIIKSSKYYLEHTLTAIQHSLIFHNYLVGKGKTDTVEDLFLSTAKSSPNLFQLRFLNMQGDEVIRVDRQGKQFSLCTEKDLQNKFHRYYFTDSIALDEGQIWYSKLDLNVEQKKIEIPYKPTLRVATPVFSGGKKVGLLIANYNMSEFLEHLTTSQEFYKVITDKENNVLVSNNPNQPNWTKYIPTTEQNIFVNSDRLTTLDLMINNGEDLKLHYYTQPSQQILLEKEQLQLRTILFSIVSLFVLFGVFYNRYLTFAINHAVAKQKLLNSALESFVIMNRTDLNGKITYVSQDFCNNTEYSKEELIGQDNNIVRDPETPEQFYKELWSTIKQGKNFESNIYIRTKSGKRKYWQMLIQPEYDEYGKMTGYIAYRKDKTKTIELEEFAHKLQEEVEKQTAELVERNKKILELSQTKELFLANMSHEIRTPLNGIIGIVDMLLDNRSIDGYVREKIEILKHTSFLLLYIINDILDFSALQLGKIKLIEKEFSLRGLCSHLRETVHPTAVKKGLECVITVDEDVEDTLVGDEFRLTQVITNLINNAIKFTNDGSIFLNISTLQKDATHTTLELRVKDTGIGMSPEVQKNLFQAFMQGDQSNTKQHKGTGLGLVITKKIIEMMDGAITFNSELDKGTEFIITLNFPYTHNTITNEQKEELLKLQKTQTALLAEDNELNQIVLAAYFKKIGFELSIVHNGAQAVESLKEKKFDIVFMDIQMPVMDGLEASRKIREFDTKTPIIAVSAGVLPEEIEASKTAGMDMHISKPIIPEELNSVLKRYFSTQDSKVNEETVENTLVQINGIELNLVHDQFQIDTDTLYKMYLTFANDYQKSLEKLDLDPNSQEFKEYIHKLKGGKREPQDRPPLQTCPKTSR